MTDLPTTPILPDPNALKLTPEALKELCTRLVPSGIRVHLPPNSILKMRGAEFLVTSSAKKHFVLEPKGHANPPLKKGERLSIMRGMFQVTSLGNKRIRIDAVAGTTIKPDPLPRR